MDGRELKQYERWKEEVQLLRLENQELRLEVMALRPESYRQDQKIDRLQQRVEKLAAENKLLKQRIADLTAELKHKPGPAAPAFVKVNVVVKATRKRPGRHAGHEPALRPMPETIDVHQDVPVPIDTLGKPSCPHCRTQSKTNGTALTLSRKLEVVPILFGTRFV